MEKLYQDRDWLWEHYAERKESTYAMAKEERCDPKTIRNWLHKMDISVRSRGEGEFLAKRNSVIITPDFLEFLRGEIIGDGYVGMTGNRSARYSHSSAHEKYLIWLSERFGDWGIKRTGRITEHEDKHGIISYHYASRSYPELVPIYRRWYPNGKKTVPEDLKLTPIMARQWYLGDGGFDSYKRKHPGIKLATCDFDRQSVEYLIKELNKLGFKATYQPSENTIRIWVRSVPDFLEWIGPCPIPCYQYKWDYEKRLTST